MISFSCFLIYSHLSLLFFSDSHPCSLCSIFTLLFYLALRFNLILSQSLLYSSFLFYLLPFLSSQSFLFICLPQLTGENNQYKSLTDDCKNSYCEMSSRHSQIHTNTLGWLQSVYRSFLECWPDSSFYFIFEIFFFLQEGFESDNKDFLTSN